MTPRFVRRTASIVAALALASCFGDSTGPSLHRGRLLIAPVMDQRAAEIVLFDSVHVHLVRPADGSVAFDTTVFFPPGTDTLTLDLAVTLTAATEQFTLSMDMIDGTTNTIVFRSPPTTITAVAGSGGTPARPVLTYVGPGSNAAGVRFVGVQPSAAFFSDTLTFVAEAYDSQGVKIANTPLFWTSSDSLKARVLDRHFGKVVAGSQRGTAIITAALLTPPPPQTAPLLVQPKPVALVVQGGNTQTGTVGAALPSQVVARVNAADGLGVQGIPVTFTAGSGAVSKSVDTTDVNGDAHTAWTLGTTSGSQSLTAAAAAAGLSPASVNFTATAAPGAAKSLIFTVGPTTVVAGQAMSPAVVVTARDNFGNTATGFTGPVTIAVGTNPGSATLGGTTTVNAVAGVATFNNLTLSSPQVGYTFVASATGLTNATSGGFAVNANLPTQLQFQAQPASAVAGASLGTITVRELDANGNLSSTATDVITLALGANPASDTLQGTLTVTAAGGIATFTGISLRRAANGYTIAATASGLGTGTSSAFNITAGAKSALAIGVQPASTAAGSPVTPAVQVRITDAFGNTVPGATDLVTLALAANPTSDTLQGSTAIAATNGIATFASISLRRVGAGYTIQATATGLTSVTTSAFAVTAGGGAQLAFTTSPATSTAGAAFSPVVTVEVHDAFGNLVTTATDVVTLALAANPGNDTLQGTAVHAAVNGIATFPGLFLRRAATGYTVQATAPGRTSATSASFDITVGAPSALQVLTQPRDTIAGAGISGASGVRFRVVDSQGNLVSGATNTITLALGANPTGDALQGTVSAAASGGIAAFPGVFLRKASAGYTISAASAGLTSVATSSFAISAGAAAQLGFTTAPPVSSPQNVPFAVVVAAQDAFGNTVTTFSGAVTLAIGTNPAAGTLTGGGAVSASSGLANFPSVSIDNLGTGYTLSASATGLVSATSAAFDITSAGSANQWTNAAGGNWSVAANWSKNAVPVATDTVLIVAAGTYTVTMDIAPLFNRIVVGGASGTQTLNTNGKTLNGSTMSVGTHGVLDLVNSTAVSLTTQSQGTIIVRGTSTLGATLTTGIGSLTQLEGNGSQGNAQLAVPQLINNGTLDMTSVGGGFSDALVLSGGGAITNAASGTITVSPGSGGARTLTGLLSNQGTVTINTPFTLSQPLATHVSSGTINVANGDWTLVLSGGGGPSFNNTGTVNIAVGHVWSISGGTLFQNGTVSGAGTLSLSGMTASLGVNFSNAGTGLVLNAVTVTGPGTLTNATGQTLALVNSTVNAPLINQGTLIVRGGSALGDTIATVAGSTLQIEGNGTQGNAQLTLLNKGLTNNATLDLTSVGGGFASTLSMPAGPLVNAAAGTITASAGSGGPRTIAGTLNNQGHVTLNQAFALSQNGGQHQNSGTIDVTGANWSLSQSGSSPSFTNTGTVNIGSGFTWSVSGGTLNQNGTVAGSGTLSLNSLTTSLGTNVSNATTGLAINSSTINGPGTLPNATGQTLAIVNSTVNAPVINQGTLIVRGTSALGDTLTTVAGSTLQIEGNGSQGNAQLTMANKGLANNATLDLTSVGGGFSSTLSMPAGPLVNASAGTITASAGSGGPRTIAGTLNNQGHLTVNQVFVLTQNGGQHQNSGTIDVTGVSWTLNQSGSSPSFTNTGTVNIGAGLTWTISGGTLNQNGTVAGAGTLALSGVTAALASGLSNATTVLQIANSTINGPGSLTNATGQSLALVNSTVNTPLVNQGTLIVRGTSALGDTLTTVAGSTLQIEGNGSQGNAQLTMLNKGFTNNAILDLTSVGGGFSSTLTLSAGSLVNAATGTITATLGTGGTRNLNGTLNNQGHLALSAPFALSQNGAQHQNSGTIDVTGVSWSLNQGGSSPTFTNTGTVNIGAGLTWTINGGAFTQNGTINGPGTLVLTSLTAALASSYSTAGAPLSVSNSTINGPGSLTNATGQTLPLVSTTINVPIVNQGTLIVRGTGSFTDTLNTAAGSTLQVEGNGSQGNAQLTLTNKAFTNNGLVDLTSVGGGFASTLTLSVGTLVNPASGTVQVSAGSGGSRTLNANVSSSGAIAINQTLVQFGTNFTSTGVISIAGPASLVLSDNAGTGSLSGSVTGGGTLAVTNGDFSLAGNLALAGSLTMSGGGVLDHFNGHTVTVGGNLQLANTSRVDMTGATDSMVVAGNVIWGTNSAFVTLSNGVLAVGGDFAQSGNSASFQAGSNHHTTFTGSGGHVVSFANPGTTSSLSRFGTLELLGTSSITLSSAAFASGSLIAAGAGPVTVAGQGNTLTVTGLSVNATVFDHVKLVDNGSVARLDNATFQNYATSDIPLAITYSGSPVSLTVNNPNWGTFAPSGGGQFLSVNGPLTLDLVNSTPADGSTATTTTGGGVVNWPGATLKTWTGATSTDWFTASNWSQGSVPTGTSSVSIPVTTNHPILTGVASVVNLTVASGATLDLGGFTLTASGNVDGGTTITNGTVLMTGAATTVQGTIANLTASGSTSLAGRLVVGNLLNPLNGSLDLNGHTATAATVNVQGTGTISMTHAADSLVGSTVIFQGADETGKLTNGVIAVSGGFSQGNTPLSFVASGSHKVAMVGTTGLSTIGMGGGVINNLDFAGLGASVRFSSNATVTGTVNVLSPSDAPGRTVIVGALTGNMNFWGAQNTVLTGAVVPDTLFTNLTLTNASATLPAQFALRASAPASVTGTLLVTSGLALGGRAHVEGDLVVSGGVLTLGGHTLQVTGNYAQNGTGQLAMTSAADSFLIAQSANFIGGSENGKLTAGVLMVDGPFAEVGSTATDAFAASGTHLTVLRGSVQTSVPVAFTTPGTSSAQSHFQNLSLVQPTSHSFDFSGSTGSVTWVNGNLALDSSQGILDGVDTLLVAGNIDNTTRGNSGVIMAGVGVGGTLSTPAAVWTPNATVFFGGTSQLVPGNTIAYNDVILRGAGKTLNDSLSTGNLFVESAFDLSGHKVRVGGDMVVQGAGNILMSANADSLLVSGDLTFSGSGISAPSAGLTQVGGSFLVTSATPGAYAAGQGHIDRLSNATLASLGTTHPGAGATHLGAVEIDGNVVVSGAVVAFGKTKFTANANLTGAEYEGQDSIITVSGARISNNVLTVGFGLDATAGSAIAPDTLRFSRLINGFPNGPTYNTLWTDLAFATDSLVLPSNLTLNHSLRITHGRVVLPGAALLTITDSIVTVNGGVLSMRDPNTASVSVGKNVNFSGGSEAGELHAGFMTVGGNFTQGSIGGSDAASFAPDTGFTVVLNGTPGQTVTFFNPGTSYFTNVQTTDGGSTVTFASDVHVVGNQLRTGGSRITGSGVKIVLHHADLEDNNGITIDSLILRGPGPTGTAYANLSGALVVDSGTVTPSGGILGTASGDVVVQGSGVLEGIGVNGSVDAAGNLVVQGNGVFNMTQMGTVNVGGDALFNSNVPNTSLNAGTLNVTGNFVQGFNAQSFVASGVHITSFNGPASTISMGNPGFSGGSHFATLDISSGTTMLGVSAATIDASIESGATLTSGGARLTATGTTTLNSGGTLSVKALAEASISQLGGTYSVDTTITIGGTGATPSVLQNGINYKHLVVSDTANWGFGASVSGNLTVTGYLDVLDFSIDIPGDFATGGSGVINETNGGNVEIHGNALFDGGDESGHLTLGDLRLHGNFTQRSSNTANSFQQSQTMSTSFIGTAAQSIDFANPAAINFGSRFGTLLLDNNVQVASSALAAASIQQDASSNPVISSTAGGGDLRVADMNMTGLTLDNIRLRVVGPGTSLTSASGITFLNQGTNIQFGITKTGGGPFTLNNATFDLTAASAVLVSTTGSSFTLNVTNSNVANSSLSSHPSYVQQGGGTTVTFTP